MGFINQHSHHSFYFIITPQVKQNNPTNYRRGLHQWFRSGSHRVQSRWIPQCPASLFFPWLIRWKPIGWCWKITILTRFLSSLNGQVSFRANSSFTRDLSIYSIHIYIYTKKRCSTGSWARMPQSAQSSLWWVKYIKGQKIATVGCKENDVPVPVNVYTANYRNYHHL